MQVKNLFVRYSAVWSVYSNVSHSWRSLFLEGKSRINCLREQRKHWSTCVGFIYLLWVLDVNCQISSANNWTSLSLTFTATFNSLEMGYTTFLWHSLKSYEIDLLVMIGSLSLVWHVVTTCLGSYMLVFESMLCFFRFLGVKLYWLYTKSIQ